MIAIQFEEVLGRWKVEAISSRGKVDKKGQRGAKHGYKELKEISY